jgi:hypothetical protein
MSENQSRRAGRAPGRFVPTRKVRESAKLTKSVRETPIKRFDSKEMMERDLERYRADARARLLKNGFDIPAFLMPKVKTPPEDEDETIGEDPIIEQDIPRPGPRPTPLISDKQIAKKRKQSGDAAPKAKPRRHVYVQNKATGLFSLGQVKEAEQGQTGAQAMNPAIHAEAQARAIAKEKSAYDEYIESLNGGPTLLDHARQQNEDDNGISGRVDELKEAEVRQSRVDLPDTATDWAAQDDLQRKRREILAKQAAANAQANATNGSQRKAVNWNKALARMAAYLIAAVAVGYVLVLTVSEFSNILAN